MTTELVKAKEGKTLEAATDKEILIALGTVATLVGITKLPEQVEKMLLVNALRKHYPNTTVEDIVLSFEMAITGKLPSVKVEHYGTLDFMYVSGILKAFNTYRNLHMQQNPVTSAPALEQDTETGKLEKELAAANYFLERYKGNKDAFIPVQIARFLNANGLSIMVGDNTFEKYLSRAKRLKTAKKAKAGLGDLRRIEGQSVTNEATRLAIKDYFDSLIKAGKKIEL